MIQHELAAGHQEKTGTINIHPHGLHIISIDHAHGCSSFSLWDASLETYSKQAVIEGSPNNHGKHGKHLLIVVLGRNIAIAHCRDRCPRADGLFRSNEPNIKPSVSTSQVFLQYIMHHNVVNRYSDWRPQRMSGWTQPTLPSDTPVSEDAWAFKGCRTMRINIGTCLRCSYMCFVFLIDTFLYRYVSVTNEERSATNLLYIAL